MAIAPAHAVPVLFYPRPPAPAIRPKLPRPPVPPPEPGSARGGAAGPRAAL